MPRPYKNLIPYFFGRDADDEGGPEDPIKYLENVKSTINIRIYPDEIKKPDKTGLIFRLHLKGKASLWYKKLSPHIRTNWNHLEAAFLSRFNFRPSDPNRFFNLLYNLRQNGRTISEYIEEGNRLKSQCPERFRRSLGRSFVTGLDEGREINLAEFYLRNKTNPSYAQAKRAVIKAHERFTQKSPSDTVRNYLPPKPSTSVTHSDLVASSQEPEELPILQPSDTIQYRPLNTSQNHTGRMQADHGIYCNHCQEEGHYSISCTKPVASSAQLEASRLSSKKLQNIPRQYLLSHNQAQLHPKSLSQAYEYPQNLSQAHQHAQSLSQAYESPQNLIQAHQHAQNLNQAYQWAQSFNQDPESPSQAHHTPQSLNQAHQYLESLYQAYQYPQSLYQDHKYPQRLNQVPQSSYQANQYPQSLHQDHQYPQRPNQAPQSSYQANQYPQSLHQDHQYPLRPKQAPPSSYQAYQYPQSPNQPTQSSYQAYVYSQSPNQAHKSPQGLSQAHQYPLSPNQADKHPQSLNQAHRFPQSLNQAQQYPLSPNQADKHPQSLNQAHQYPQSLDQAHRYPLSPNQADKHPQSLNQAHQYPQSLAQAHRYPPSAFIGVAQFQDLVSLGQER